MSHVNFLKQPKAFYPIFSIEVWERFGYYGMQAILVLYMVKHLGMDDATAFNTWSAFSALLYSLISVGGFIGDRVLGTKRTLFLGAAVLVIGYFLLGIGETQAIYLGLGFIVAGNGLFKANPSSLLSKCYEKGDPRLDGAFTLYYMAVNIGSFISMAIVPVIAGTFGWRYGFWTSSLGMLAALLSFFAFFGWIKHIGSPAGKMPLSFTRLAAVILGTIAVALASAWVLRHYVLADIALVTISMVVFGLFGFEIVRAPRFERAKMIVAFILILEAIGFYILYQQMSTSLNFFAINNIEHSIFGFAIDPLSFQALNPFWIIVMSPTLAFIYTHLGRSNKDLSMPSKFCIGMLLCALSFLVLWISKFFANENGIVSSTWIILSYFFQSTGELMVAGLGLAMIASLVPQRLMGFLMGAWFLSSALAMMMGGFVASLTNIPKGLPSTQSLGIYTHVFLEISIASFIVTAIMFALIPYLKRKTAELN